MKFRDNSIYSTGPIKPGQIRKVTSKDGWSPYCCFNTKVQIVERYNEVNKPAWIVRILDRKHPLFNRNNSYWEFQIK